MAKRKIKEVHGAGAEVPVVNVPELPLVAPAHRRDYSNGLVGLNLPPELVEAVNGLMADDPREIIDQVDRELQLVANEQFELVRLSVEAREKERKLLWGNKFPYKLGQKPGEDPPVEPPARRYRRGRVPK